jgi:hypothetical protein
MVERHFESSIPLILIIILGIFVAGRMGIVDFSSLPVLNSIVPAPATKVGVVGHLSGGLENFFTSEEFRVKGMVLGAELKQEYLFAGTLDSFDIIVLQNQPVCDREARKTITDRVRAGAKLILIGDACTKVTQDSTAVGWDVGIDLLDKIVPVSAYGPTHEKSSFVPRRDVTGKFTIIETSHPIFNGIKNYEATFKEIWEPVPKPNQAKILALINTEGSSTVSPTIYGIVENKGALFGGKVLYFGYDPGAQPAREMFLNALLYLKSQRG